MSNNQLIGYGLTQDLMAQLGPSPAVAAARLRERGIDGVFLKVLDAATATALKDAGLVVYASQPVFLADAELWARFPHSRPRTDAGAPAPVEEWYHPALPTDDAFRAMRLRQIEALLARVPLDGLWLDFIRWPARWEKRTPTLYHSSFDAHTLARFAADTGIAPPGMGGATVGVDTVGDGTVGDGTVGDDTVRWILDHAADAWFSWRCGQIAAFVADVADLRNRIRPAAKLGLFTIPWTGGALDELPVAQANTRIVGQDPVRLGRVADILSPMVYHRLCGRAGDWPAAVTAHFANATTARIWPVIERLADDETFTRTEFDAVLAACRAAGSGPVIVFNLAGMLRAWPANSGGR